MRSTALAAAAAAVFMLNSTPAVPHQGAPTSRPRQGPGAGSATAVGTKAPVARPSWATQLDGRSGAALRASGQAVLRARQRMQDGDLAGAEADARQAVELAPVLQMADGRRARMGGAEATLGEICLRRGRNREALVWLLPQTLTYAGHGVSMNVVIAYCRLGSYRSATRYYPVGPRPPRIPARHSPLDMPGTATLAALEASALVSRGADAGAEGRRGDALDDYLAAERLVPRNPLVAYLVARTLQDIDSRLDAPAIVRIGSHTIPRSHIALEELPRWDRASALGHEPIRSEARQKAEGVRHWLRLHPPSPGQPGRRTTSGGH